MITVFLITAVIAMASAIPAENECVPGVKFYRKCNVCACSSDGLLASCTRIACPPGDYDETGRYLGPVGTRVFRSISKANPSAVTVCEPGKIFMNDCNRCVCNQEGTSAVCTQLFCFEKNTDRRKRSVGYDSVSCAPGETYKDDCNFCICSASGKPHTCTRIACVPGFDVPDQNNIHKYKRDLDVKLELDCEPRSTFKDDCNLCHCSESGEYAICTAKACVPGLNFGARFQKGQQQ